MRWFCITMVVDPNAAIRGSVGSYFGFSDRGRWSDGETRRSFFCFFSTMNFQSIKRLTMSPRQTQQEKREGKRGIVMMVLTHTKEWLWRNVAKGKTTVGTRVNNSSYLWAKVGNNGNNNDITDICLCRPAVKQGRSNLFQEPRLDTEKMCGFSS